MLASRWRTLVRRCGYGGPTTSGATAAHRGALRACVRACARRMLPSRRSMRKHAWPFHVRVRGPTNTRHQSSNRYTAPEILAGKRYGERVDCWSAGVIAYILRASVSLSLSLPFWVDGWVDRLGCRGALNKQLDATHVSTRFGSIVPPQWGATRRSPTRRTRWRSSTPLSSTAPSGTTSPMYVG